MLSFDVTTLIGETTEYDKKQALEKKNRKAGVKVLVLLLMVWEEV